MLPWTLGASLRDVEWTHVAGPARTVAILQGAIPQDMKWLLEKQQDILDSYAAAASRRPGRGAHRLARIRAAGSGQSLCGLPWRHVVGGAARATRHVLMGVIRQDDGDAGEVYFNSLLGLGLGDSEPAFYDKRHLVPFGEYFPGAGLGAQLDAADEPARIRISRPALRGRRCSIWRA